MGDNCPKAEADLIVGGAMRGGATDLTICRLGDWVCDRLGGAMSCLTGSMARDGDNVPAGPAWKDWLYGKEEELA